MQGVTIVVGGQYGSEGKGKVVQKVLEEYSQFGDVVSIRCGRPNSGHTVVVNGKPVILKQLPSGVVVSDCDVMIPAGAVVDHDLLLKEIEMLGIAADRVWVDPRAVVLEASDRAAERRTVGMISSTGSGNGQALVRRMCRVGGVRLMADVPDHDMYRICNVADAVQRLYKDHMPIVVEGNQGFGLSLLHGQYPFTTSRDVTASGFASECGIPPQMVKRVICVLRTYPIRVGNAEGSCSGPFPAGEITWQEIGRRGGVDTPEYTSVTKRLRRVGNFDWKMTRQALAVNGATEIALMGLDRLDKTDADRSWLTLRRISKEFIQKLEDAYQIPVRYIGTGPLCCERIK